MSHEHAGKPSGDASVDAADQVDLVFRALASRQRRQILALLATGAGAEDARCCGPNEVCACVFAERLALSASTVSHHMKVLAEAGLVSSRKDGLWVHYRLRPEMIAAVVGEVMSLCGPACVPAEESGSGSTPSRGRTRR